MATTLTHPNLVITKWRKQIYREWRRGNLFSPYMGESPLSVIQLLNDLKDGGDQMFVPIVTGLRGPGVSTGPLTGNEEKLDQYGMKIWIDWSRNGVLLTRAQQRKSAIEQLDLVRPLLSEWQQLLLRDELILAMGAIPSESPPLQWGNEATAGQRVNGIIYDYATTAQKNTWHDANSDRLLYGVLKGNFVSGNHASSLANVDNTADKLSAAMLNFMKRTARKSNPGITPTRENEDQGREWFVVFCGSNAFRDLNADTVIQNANLQARAREGNGMDRNPLFQGGDIVYNGMIIREIPEIDDYLTVTGAGASGIDVAPVFLCGQNALALAWGQMPRPTERSEDDYGFVIGRGVESVYGVGKVYKRHPSTSLASPAPLKQWGILQAYVASVGDA